MARLRTLDPEAPHLNLIKKEIWIMFNIGLICDVIVLVCFQPGFWDSALS